MRFLELEKPVAELLMGGFAEMYESVGCGPALPNLNYFLVDAIWSAKSSSRLSDACLRL